ncbi:MAG: protein kinase [Planctomycetota bacterium]|nr:protein kinase [Planctomycetota bacterium]
MDQATGSLATSAQETCETHDGEFEEVGTIVGPYTLREQIGEGGMGVVFVAEQTEPVRRKVAVKIIKPGMDTKQVIARFEAERQALALMDHPYIARVMDAGTAASGRPYFVMELVRGVTITKFCDQRNLSISGRLALFISVCRAVQHAHQKGIIHRDIKPTNVMVTLHDGVPVPKVIDFGVAKSINQELTERTVYTQLNVMIGTPVYMSPEQAEMSGLDVDTRSDVYSLGVLLYELLTGQTPFDRDVLKQAGFDEMRRIIRSDEPAMPSSRLSTLGAQLLSTVSRERAKEPHELRNAIRGDLDWIVMKAMEKDRTRRYESASAMAADLERYLSDLPVEARPPSIAYRFRKFAKRRKPFVVFLSLTASFLLAGMVGLVIASTVILQERADAIRHRERAEQRAEALRRREATISEYLYASDIQLASREYHSGALEAARRRLERHVKPDGIGDIRGFEWHYLWNLCQDDHREFRGDDRDVFDVTFSLDGQWLASAGRSHKVIIWDAVTGERKLELKEFSDDVNAIAFTSDGTNLATAEENRVLRVWNIESGDEVSRIDGFKYPVANVFFLSDGRSLVVTDVDWKTNEGNISTWDYKTRERLRSAEGYRALAFDRDTQTLAACTPAGEVSLWSIPALEKLSSWPGHVQHVTCGCFSSDGASLATGCKAGKVKLWKLSDLSEQELPREHLKATRSLAFSRDGKILTSVSDDGTARVWDIDTKTTSKICNPGNGRLWTVAASPDDQSIAVGCEDGSVCMWNLDSAVERRHVVKLGSEIVVNDSSSLMAFTRDGRTVVSVVDAIVGKAVGDFPDPDGQTVMSLAFNPSDGSIWTGNASGTVRKLDLASRTYSDSIQLLEGVIGSLDISPGGRYLAAAERNSGGRIVVHDLETSVSVLLPLRQRHTNPVNQVVGFVNDQMLLTGCNNEVTAWDPATGTRLPLQLHTDDWLRHPAVSPDGQVLAMGRHNDVQLWRVSDGAELDALVGHLGPPNCAAFSPNGRTLATGGSDGKLKLWHLPTRQFLFDLEGHSGSIQQASFSPDGRRLLSIGASADGGREVIGWSAESSFAGQPSDPPLLKDLN